jgi:hypothetical protein
MKQGGPAGNITGLFSQYGKKKMSAGWFITA